MDFDLPTLVARGRVLLDAPPLSRSEKSRRGLEDPKWTLGELLQDVPDDVLESFASALGADRLALRQYRDVAAKWPRVHRVAASWTAHRELKDHPARFDVIHAGMTMRQAAAAAGKTPLDAKPRERMTVEERAAEVIALLADKAVNDLVLRRLAERRDARRTLRAARAAADERSAEYREARRNLREAQAAKSPDQVFLEVIFKLQETAEYLNAVVHAAMDVDAPLVPDHRKPDVIRAIEAVSQAATSALSTLSDSVIDITATKVSPLATLLELTIRSDSDQ